MSHTKSISIVLPPVPDPLHRLEFLSYIEALRGAIITGTNALYGEQIALKLSLRLRDKWPVESVSVFDASNAELKQTMTMLETLRVYMHNCPSLAAGRLLLPLTLICFRVLESIVDEQFARFATDTA